MSDTEPDRVPGAPHPRETPRLFGQDAAEHAFLDAVAANRVHHAWMIAGPRGIGKATLAWRIARFLLATPPIPADAGLFGAPAVPQSLDIAPDHPVARRIQAGSEPGLATITRSVNDKTGRLRDVIAVEDIRALQPFFGLSATDGGHRVVILDCADEMNTNAANALLKLLEEPPARSTLLLVTHQPSRLLPTIRSRCRSLRLSPLGTEDLARALEQAGGETPATQTDASALSALAGGSVGDALRLIGSDGLKTYADLIALFGTLPALDRARASALAQSVGGRGAGDRLDLVLDLTEIALARLARTGATGGNPPAQLAAPDEDRILTRLAPDAARGRAWADLATLLRARTRHGQAVNLDPASLVLDTVHKITATAAG